MAPKGKASTNIALSVEGAGDPELAKRIGAQGASIFANTLESEASGGAGDTASPARDPADYPKLVAALKDIHDRDAEPPRTVRVTSQVNGFRRAGISHPAGATEYPIWDFNPEQLEAMLNEPALVIELV